MNYSGYNRQIFVYGGSFDPPTIAHYLICRWVIKALNPKGLVIAPAFEHNFGKTLTPFHHRFNMCWKTFASKKTLISGAEEYLPTPNTTYDLLMYLKDKNEWCAKREEEKFGLVIGSDAFNEFERWSNWDKISNLADLFILERNGYPIDNKLQLPIKTFPLVLPTTSSTEVRNRLSNNRSIEGLVSNSVKEYIWDNELYINAT